MLNTVRVGNIDDDIEQLLKARFIHESDENYAKDALDMYAENELVLRTNEAILNDFAVKFWQNTKTKIPDNCKYPLALILVAQNQSKQTQDV